jgi:hypothetical protein
MEEISTFFSERNHFHTFYREKVFASRKVVSFMLLKQNYLYFFVVDTNAAFLLRRIFALDKYHNNSRAYYFSVQIASVAAFGGSRLEIISK